jgi:hypothetical protein
MTSVAPRELPVRIGRYLMFGAFARGGMASVHLGRLTGPAGFSRLVALKLLHPVYAEEPEYYTMLLDEARLSSRIVHPNVVQTLDVVQDGDRLCIVMEYVHGVSLAKAASLLAKSGERMPPEIAAAIVVGVLHGLHAAHEARGEDGQPLGIVHRDISPQNVVVGADGVARVLDFGVAKALRKQQVTREGHIKGKIAYMAPEQLSGAPVTRQVDLRAAGVVLWEALVGRRLFEEENEARLITRVLTEDVPPPSRVDFDVPQALDDVVARAVAFERRSRFATAEEMAEALRGALAPATREEVADWVQRTAGDDLDARAELVRLAETHDGASDVAGAPVVQGAPELGGAPDVELSGVPWGADPGPGEAPAEASRVVSRPPRAAAGGLTPWPARVGTRFVLAAAGVAACAAAAFALFAQVPSRAAPGTDTEARTGSPDGPPRPGAASAPPSAVPVASGGVSSAPAPQVAPLVLDPIDVPAVGVPVAATEPRTTAVKARVRTPPRSSCDPPFSIDSDGMKHYKPSCLK